MRDHLSYKTILAVTWTFLYICTSYKGVVLKHMFFLYTVLTFLLGGGASTILTEIYQKMVILSF